jgi:UrcA family protein
MKRLLTSLSVAVLCATGFASVAAADPLVPWEQADQVSRTVYVGDLDLHTQAGAKTAANRVSSAADSVCSDYLAERRTFDFMACRDQAIAEAVASLQAPMVSAALGRQAFKDVASR